MAELPPLLHLLSLQPELVTDVLAWDVLALARLAQTSKAVHKIVMNSGVWRRICFRERVYYTNSKLSHVPITEDSTISGTFYASYLSVDVVAGSLLSIPHFLLSLPRCFPSRALCVGAPPVISENWLILIPP